MAGRSELRLELVRLESQGKTYSLHSNAYEQVGASQGKRTAKTVGIGTAVGAAIGAGVGAGSGTGVELATKGQQIIIPAETQLDFKLASPVVISYSPDKNRSRF